MAGSFEEARAQILSLRPADVRGRAVGVRIFGRQAVSAGSVLQASAARIGGQRGDPNRAYAERVTPTARWLTDLGRPTADTGAALDAAAAAGDRAQMVLAKEEEALARFANSAGATPTAMAAAEAAALVALNQAIGEVTRAYEQIQPAAPTTAPVVAGGSAASAGSGGGARTGSSRAGRGAEAASAEHASAEHASATGAVAAAVGAGAVAAGTGAALRGGSSAGAALEGAAPGVAATTGTGGAALGPTSGPFAGFVHDPTTGNLVDPGTGRQVDAGGRFLDPITGQPFGPASPFVSRLEGLDGGVSPFGGLLGGPGGVGAAVPAGVGAAGGFAPGGVGLGAGGPGAGGVGAGGVGGLGGAALVAGGAVPFLAGGGAGGGASGAGARGTGYFAGLYGGVVPPSLAGENPAGAQLREQAAENLSTSAGTAQRYSAIASGQAPGAYLPPIGGVGMGGGGGGAARPRRRGGAPADGEPAAVWGAPGGGALRKRSAPASTDVEDDEIWDGGTAAPPRLDGC